MKIIDFSSNLSKGEFLCRFTFEDDTDVFLSSDGWECVNYNNIRSDLFYIEIAQNYYSNINL